MKSNVFESSHEIKNIHLTQVVLITYTLEKRVFTAATLKGF